MLQNSNYSLRVNLPWLTDDFILAFCVVTNKAYGNIKLRLGWSHLHNTWESEATISAPTVRGMKRFENFLKKKEEIDLWLRAVSPEDREYYYCQTEMNRNVLANYCKADRIIGNLLLSVVRLFNNGFCSLYWFCNISV